MANARVDMTVRAKSMTAGDTGRRGDLDLTVAAGVARTLVHFAEGKGAQRGILLRRAHIQPADLGRQDDRIALHKYVVLMRAAKELSRDPALALHFGETVDLSEMSIIGHLDHGIETMADVFAQINRYAGLLIETGGPSPRLVVEHRASEFWILDRRPNPNEFPELTESTFARMVCGTRRFFGERRLLKTVHVTHSAPEHRAEYERVFQAPLVFESTCNALVYHASWWAQKITRGSPYVSGVLAAHADKLLKELEQSKSTRGRVEQVLASRLQSGDTAMATVAGELGLTRQTLLRRLRVEGVTFAQLLHDVRQATAVECLRERGLSVSETAYRVGFSDPAPFSRAFKRWTGRSPRDFLSETRESHRDTRVDLGARRLARSTPRRGEVGRRR